jgi:hypothetical protein
MSLVYPYAFQDSVLEHTTAQRQILESVAEGDVAVKRKVWNQQTRESKTQEFAIYVQLYSPKTEKATEDRSKKEVGNKTGVETRKLQAVNP